MKLKYQELHKLNGLLLASACLMVLSACGQIDNTELRTWMDQQRKSTPATVKKLVPPNKFEPVPYTMASELDPFDTQKLKSALAKARAAAGSSSVQPDLKRRREALEAFPLDAITMVGFVLRQNKPYALINAGGGLYKVTIGNYLGNDFGKIVTLSEKELVLKELVQDGSGEWSERISRLTIQEAAKEAAKEGKK